MKSLNYNLCECIRQVKVKKLFYTPNVRCYIPIINQVYLFSHFRDKCHQKFNLSYPI